MADKPVTPPWDYLIEKSGGNTTTETADAYEQALADGDTETAQRLYDQACRDAS